MLDECIASQSEVIRAIVSMRSPHLLHGQSTHRFGLGQLLLGLARRRPGKVANRALQGPRGEGAILEQARVLFWCLRASKKGFLWEQER